MVDRFARRWAAALTGDDRVDGSASAVAELRPLVVRPARVVAADRADDALAHDVCAVLAGVGRMAGVVPALLTLLDGLGVTVDVAAGHLRDPELPAQVAAILGDTGLPPELLHLELAESAVIGAGPGPVDALVGLAGAGVRLVVDGFGTGYSHLAHLARLPVSELKTPPSFLADVPVHDRVLPAIISLAHAMGLTVTAEGVENRAQVELLRARRCDAGQGRWFGAPMSADGVTRLLAARRTPGGDGVGRRPAGWQTRPCGRAPRAPGREPARPSCGGRTAGSGG